jgi:hypothetical protein
LYLRITGPFLHTQFTVTLRILKHAAIFLVQSVKIKLPSKTGYRRKDKGGDGSDRKTRKKTQEATG